MFHKGASLRLFMPLVKIVAGIFDIIQTISVLSRCCRTSEGVVLGLNEDMRCSYILKIT